METHKKNIKTSQRIEYGIYQFLYHFIGRERVLKLLGKRERAFCRKLYETIKKSGEGKAIEIERRTNLSLEEFRKNYLKKGVPVILEGAANDWDCVKKWSLDYFKDLHGTDEVVLWNESGAKSKSETSTLAELIDNIKGGGSKFDRFYSLVRRHPEHINDFDYKFLKQRRNAFISLEEFKVTMGGKDKMTPLHNENRGNLFVQANGEKKWIIFPPYYSSVIDPDHLKYSYRPARLKMENGFFDLFNPVYDKSFSRYKYIDHYETTLKPGDILWVPPFYWHTVINATSSIAVSYRWFNPVLPFRIAPLYMFLDYFSTKPPFVRYR